MENSSLALLGSFLTFTGGVLLALDSLLVTRRLRTEQGGKLLLDTLGRHGVRGIFVDEHGTALDTAEKLQLWVARGTQRRANAGFLLLTVGFLFDLIARLPGHT